MVKILLVEDNDLLRDGFASILQDEDFEVYEAENGIMALELLGIQQGKDTDDQVPCLQPDLILCDIMMPEMDGHELLKALQKHPQLSFVPFIFLTAKATPSDIRKGMSLGASDYLLKPCPRSTLLNAINIRLELAKRAKLLIQEREEHIRKQMFREIPDQFGNLLNAVIGVFQALRDETDPIEQQLLIADGLKASGEFYRVLWTYYRLLEKL